MDWIRRKKNSSYFLQLEKSNYCNKIISQLDIDGTVINNPEEILEAERIFYKKLYSQPYIDTDIFMKNMETFSTNNSIPVLDSEKKERSRKYVNRKRNFR